VWLRFVGCSTTIQGKARRLAFAPDGDYFSKPNAEGIAAIIEEMMAE
jgi:hypothetical protein